MGMKKKDKFNYKGFVGPKERYDIVGAMQLTLLYFLDSREHHHLLDRR